MRDRTCITALLFVLQLETILDSFGYTLIFGPILAKMLRIYYIFHNPTPKKKACIRILSKLILDH